MCLLHKFWELSDSIHFIEWPIDKSEESLSSIFKNIYPKLDKKNFKLVFVIKNDLFPKRLWYIVYSQELNKFYFYNPCDIDNDLKKRLYVVSILSIMIPLNIFLSQFPNELYPNYSYNYIYSPVKNDQNFHCLYLIKFMISIMKKLPFSQEHLSEEIVSKQIKFMSECKTISSFFSFPFLS